MIVISPDIFSLQIYGGISRYFVELHRALREMGLDARIYSGLHINKHVQTQASVIGRYTDRTRIRRLRRQLNELSFRLWCWAQSAELVVHRSFYGWPSRPKCCRLVTTIHDLIPEMFTGRPASSIEGSIHKLRAAKQADAICVNSVTTQRDLERLWGIPCDRVWVTPLGVRRNEPSDRKWAKDTRGFFLHVGPRAGYKNGMALLAAFAASGLWRDMRLVCFGGGAFSTEEQDAMARLQILGRVEHHTGCDADLAACYRQAVGFVCPSLYEGFGLPVLEAMSHGCPVACSQAGALPEVAGAFAQYFDPTNVDSIVHELLRLAEARCTLAERLEAAEAHAMAFTWSNTAQQTVLAYRGIRH